jgi:hypothetical protein
LAFRASLGGARVPGGVEFTERTDLTLARILERQCCFAHKPGPKIPYRLELTRSLETRTTRTFLLIALNVSPHPGKLEIHTRTLRVLATPEENADCHHWT